MREKEERGLDNRQIWFDKNTHDADGKKKMKL